MQQLARSMSLAIRGTQRSSLRFPSLSSPQAVRAFHNSHLRAQREYSDPAAHRNFYKSHGRAIFKALTLAFFSYQVFYWTWTLFETEQIKDQKGYEIQALEGEVRLLEEGRKSHRPSELAQTLETEAVGKRILEEKKP